LHHVAQPLLSAEHPELLTTRIYTNGYLQV
jgi:hypothetical protein